jgi:hypothetical protein
LKWTEFQNKCRGGSFKWENLIKTIWCLRKSSRIIVIPTTSVNVLWDAIVPLSPTSTLIDRPLAKHRNSLSFGTHRWCFFNINNKRHLSVHPKEDISFGKGVYIFNFLVLIPYFFSLIELFLLQYCFRHCAFCNLDWGITIYHHFKLKKKSSMILDLHRGCTTINNFNTTGTK